MEHAESEDDDLQSVSKDGKLSMKRVDMLAQMNAWGITSALIVKVSRNDTKGDAAKDETPKILALRAFHRALEDSLFDYANSSWLEIREHCLKIHSITLPEEDTMERSELIEAWASRCWTASWTQTSKAGGDNPDKLDKTQASKASKAPPGEKSHTERVSGAEARKLELREWEEKLATASKAKEQRDPALGRRPKSASANAWSRESLM